MNNSLLDIIHIHDLIVKHFDNETEKIKTYEQQLVDVQKNINIENLSFKIKKSLIQQDEKLKTTIADIKQNSKYNFYMFYAVPLIERYKELIKTPVKISFMNSAALKFKNNKIHHEKIEIIDQYTTLLKKNQFQLDDLLPAEYVSEILNFNVNINCTCCESNGGTAACTLCKDEIKCQNCDNTEFDIDGNIFTCIVCGIQIDLINTTSCIKDIERINISSKYTYDRRSHFKECINQFQAKQNQNIPDKVFQDLYHQIRIHNLEEGDDNTPLEVKYRKLNKEHIQMFLKELNHTKYYEDLIYIYHKITNKPAEDISHIESRLMEDFDTLIEKYDQKYKNVAGQHKRKNFINIQCILYQLLIRHNYKCKHSDFSILKTWEKKNIHEEIIHDLFKDLSWNFQHMC